MKTEQLSLILSIAAVGAVTKSRFSGYTGAICGAGLPALGVFDMDQDDKGQATVKAHGVMLVLSGGAIAVGAAVESDATGRAITLASGVQNGRAMDVATAANQLIRIFR